MPPREGDYRHRGMCCQREDSVSTCGGSVGGGGDGVSAMDTRCEYIHVRLTAAIHGRRQSMADTPSPLPPTPRYSSDWGVDGVALSIQRGEALIQVHGLPVRCAVVGGNPGLAEQRQFVLGDPPATGE